MAEKEKLSLDFGIETTIQSDSAEILSSLYEEPITSVEKEEEEEITPISRRDRKVKQDDKKIENQKPQLKEQEEQVEGDIEFKKILETNLLEDEDDSEDSEDDEDEDIKLSKDKKQTPQDTDSEEGDEPIWSSLTKDLAKIGVFSLEEDEEGNIIEDFPITPEQFKERFVYEMKRGVNDTISNFLSRFGDDYRDAFDAIYVNGVNPRDYFSSKIEIDNLKDLDLTNERNQEYVVRKTLENQGFEKDDIDEEVDRLKEYGDLETVAGRYHKVLAKKEEQKLKEQAESKARELENQKLREEEYNENVFNLISDKFKTKDFDGIPVNKKFAEETMDFLTTKKYKLPNGELLTEWDKVMLESKKPENIGIRVKLAMLYQMLKADPQLSSLKRRAISEEANALFNDVARHKVKTSRKNSPIVTKKRSFFD